MSQPSHAEPHDHTHHHQGDEPAHGHEHDTNERRTFWAMLLTAGFMGAEVAGGILSGSLALLADAGHMLTDSASLAMAWAAFRISRRPQDLDRSYGYHRVQVLAAFVNGVALLGVVVWIAIEAFHRFLSPSPVAGGLMLGVAVAGLVANIVAFAILHGGSGDNLNLRGAAVHVLGDLLGSVAAIVAALVILATNWTPIDPLLSLLVVALVLRSAWFIVRRSVHILLEGTPEWLDVEGLKTQICATVPAVADVHHVHAWMLTAERPLMTLHASVHDGADYPATLRSIHRVLESRYHVLHATVQIEPMDGCADDGHPA